METVDDSLRKVPEGAWSGARNRARERDKRDYAEVSYFQNRQPKPGEKAKRRTDVSITNVLSGREKIREKREFRR